MFRLVLATLSIGRFRARDSTNRHAVGHGKILDRSAIQRPLVADGGRVCTRRRPNDGPDVNQETRRASTIASRGHEAT